MESVIDHFKYWSSGIKIPTNIINTFIESPKGEFSITLISDNSEKPYRCKIKSPSYNHLQFIKIISKNVFLADLVTIIGTIDIVFGEIDR
jgi:NADH:ubiquinone oxidoreductase subunit D